MQTHDLCDTGRVLSLLSYQVNFERSSLRVRVRVREDMRFHMFTFQLVVLDKPCSILLNQRTSTDFIRELNPIVLKRNLELMALFYF